MSFFNLFKREDRNKLAMTQLAESFETMGKGIIDMSDEEMKPEKFKEFDPYGVNQHDPGAKLDAGKPRVSMVLKGFARALWAVAELGTKGADKYTDFGWEKVKDGINRYDDAMLRHKLKEWMGEEVDPDMDVFHKTQAAWNALASLELELRKKESD